MRQASADDRGNEPVQPGIVEMVRIDAEMLGRARGDGKRQPPGQNECERVSREDERAELEGCQHVVRDIQG